MPKQVVIKILGSNPIEAAEPIAKMAVIGVNVLSMVDALPVFRTRISIPSFFAAHLLIF
jgi:selenophosphate synthase